MDYTEHQNEAIHHLDGNLQVIACAGSGKTQVLAQRVVNILPGCELRRREAGLDHQSGQA